MREHNETADAEGPTFLGLDVMHYARSCIKIDGKQFDRTIGLYEMPDAPVKSRIEDCRILFCSKNGLEVISPDSTIAYNDISYHGWCAVTIRTSHRSIFEHNMIHFSNFYKHASYPCGIKVFNQGHSFVTRNNYLYNMGCVAVWYDVGLKDNIVVNNYFKDCRTSVKIEISHRSYIAGNVMDNSRLWICNAADYLVFNNTLIDCGLDFLRNNRGNRGAWNKDFGWDHAGSGPGPLH